jgi:hypothetical protein
VKEMLREFLDAHLDVVRELLDGVTGRGPR